MTSAHLPARPFRRLAAFTLVEVLVVVGLIALLAGVLGVALRGGEGGSGLVAAERIAAGMFQSARSQAVLLGTEARVIIANDASDDGRYLRTLAIVYRDPEAPNVWRSTGDGVTLPTGLYVIPSDYPSARAPIRSSGGAGSMGFGEEFPFRESSASDGTGNWLYYAYNAQGIAAQAGEKVVLGAGRRTDATAPVEFNAEQVAGFALARFGGLITAREPQDLQ